MNQLITDLAYPFRMLGKEEFERVQFLWDTFDVVETVDADNNLYSIETSF